jgi:hypothetical protein
MFRKEEGLFKGDGVNLNRTKLSDGFFSLLKFDPSYEDEDFSKNCLAANLTPKSEYLDVFPVDCDARVANAHFCLTFFTFCRTFDESNRIREQTDLLLDPTQKQNLDFYVMKETNKIYDSIKSLNRFGHYLCGILM